MRFTVVWTKTAEADLVRIWTEARDRAAVTRSGNVIDQLLRTDPLNAGESRSEERRVLLIEPLGVDYLVSEEDRRVNVIAVWLWGG